MPIKDTKKSTPQGGTKKRPDKQGSLEFGAGNEIRTRDIHVGNVMLYQLSYSRNRK